MAEKRAFGAAKGNRFRITLGLPVAAIMNCADNTGAKNLYCIAVCGTLSLSLSSFLLLSLSCHSHRVIHLKHNNKQQQHTIPSTLPSLSSYLFQECCCRLAMRSKLRCQDKKLQLPTKSNAFLYYTKHRWQIPRVSDFPTA